MPPEIIDPNAAPAPAPLVGEVIVPEKYEFKPPEGDVIDPEMAERVSATAKELKLPAEQAQKLYDSVRAEAQTAVGKSAPIVPEKYEFKAPEGAKVDDALAERVSVAAKSMKLTAEQAQAMYDGVNAETKAFAESRQAEWQTLRESWAGAVKADPEIGGAEFDKNVGLARKVVNKFGSPNLIKTLDETGFGDHPELIRLLSKIGKTMKEDDFVLPGVQQGGEKKDMAALLYGGTPQQ